MKKVLFGMSALALLVLGSCGNDNTPTPTPPASGSADLTGDISTNRTLSKDTVYLLKGFVYVTNGATLTIEPGTVIKGDKATKGTLTVTRGSKIMAVGTADKPIVFTSNLAPGSRDKGDWGGVILLGKAPINPSGGTAKIEGGLTPTGGGNEQDYIFFGGTDANDNSGTLKYVRIEFGGVEFTPDNEINGLTMGGVGAGTTISYVQVYRSGDDSYEWFGGTVNCDHLISTYTLDDDFDTDYGFSGHVQFAVCQRWANYADVSGSNGFESDNDGNGSDNTPQTRAIFSNATIVGPVIGRAQGTTGINAKFQHGAQIRRNSSFSIVNSIITGFPFGVYIDDTKGTATHNNIDNGTLLFRNNILAGNDTNFKYTSSKWMQADATAWFATTATTELDNTSLVKFKDINKFSEAVGTPAGRPDYRLDSGSPALNGADFSGLAGFQNVSYRGAFDGNTDWTSGWANFSAESTVY